MGHVHADLVRAAGLQPAGDEAHDRLARRAVALGDAPMRDRALRPRRPARPPSSRGQRKRGRAARRPHRRRDPVRPRSARCIRARTAACARDRQTAPRARDAPRRSSPPPASPTCPCRAGARCPAARRRRCPRGSSPQCAISALTSVPRALPGAGMHDQARRLVDDDEVRRPRRRC